MKMRKIIALLFGLILLGFSSMSNAACTTNTIYLPDGRIMICTTCCYGSNCYTNCY